MDATLEHVPKAIRWLVAAQRVVSVLLLLALFLLVAAPLLARGLQAGLALVLEEPVELLETMGTSRYPPEIARFVFAWMAFIAAGFVMAEARHIAVDVIGRVVGRKGRLALEWLAAVIAGVIALAVVIAGMPFIWRTMGIGSTSAGIPMGLWRSAVLVGLALVAFHAVVNAAVGVRRGEPLWAGSTGGEAELAQDVVDRKREQRP